MSAIATPDNPADCTVVLHISGNRLVSILNALDQSLFELGRLRFEGNATVGASSWYDELHATTEAVRDILSEQRCSKGK